MTSYCLPVGRDRSSMDSPNDRDATPSLRLPEPSLQHSKTDLNGFNPLNIKSPVASTIHGLRTLIKDASDRAFRQGKNSLGRQVLVVPLCARFTPSGFGSYRRVATASRTVAGHGSAIRHEDFVPRSFKRIRLVTQEDFYACYGIVARYLNHPETAYSVKECILHPPMQGHYPYTGPLGGTPTHIVDDSMQERIVKYVQSLGLGDDLALKLSKALDLKTLRFDHGELAVNYMFDLAVATLLISLCPNIVILRIDGVRSDTPLGQFLLENNYGMLAKPVLQKLRKVQLHPVHCMDPREYARIQAIDHVRYFHRLPAINALSMEGLEEYDAGIEVFPPKSSPGIKEIRMSHVDMSTEMVCTIIRIPKTLVKYSLSTNGLQNQYGHESMLDAETIAKCLSEHNDWLRKLDIDAAICWPCIHDIDVFEEEWKVQQMSKWYFALDQRDGNSDLPLRLEDLPATREYSARSIGSLADFRALTHLSIVLIPFDPLQLA
ncbi:hypothetical protein BR93DRAFT_992384 [Coniochaeta sp. PMI_546]|nr:hypothetical protein BR93DRAFT_992384 [Coniochaeta sp. PMI_546]